MHDAQGVGLAATQVGVLRRVFVFEPDEDGPQRVVNPTLVERGDETRDRRRGLPLAAGRPRPGRALDDASCSRARTRTARTCATSSTGYGARVVQHELDHLDGVLIIDRTDDEHRKEALAHAAAPRRPSLMRIGVAATAPLGADVLERLAATHEIAFLLTRPDAPRGRGRKLAPPPAKEVAERLGIPVHQPEKPELPADGRARSSSAPTASTSRRALLERSLWLNVHPSLLPRWRGAAPVERAILAGDEETGVTIHETVAALDAGPIAAQEAFPIGDDRRRAGVRALGRGRGAAARRRARRRRRSSRSREDGVDLRREDRARRPRARPRRPASTRGGASARSRRTSARGRRCTAAA